MLKSLFLNILFFFSLSTFASSACIKVLDYDVAESTTNIVTSEYNDWADGLEKKIRKILKPVIESPDSETAKEEAAEKLRVLISRNLYLERALGLASVGLIKTLINEAREYKPQFIKQKIINWAAGIREYHSENQDQSPAFVHVDLKNENQFKVIDGQYVKIYQSRPINYQTVIDRLPSLRNRWMMQHTPKPGAKVEVVSIPVKDVPGVVLYITNDLVGMNNLFLRMSTYVEVKEELYVGHKLFWQRAAGHDLRGEDILRYLDAINSNPQFYTSKDKEEQFRLNQEREFSDKVLAPLLNKDPKRVALGIAAGYYAKSILSHEILHGQFFLNAELRNAVIDFWRHKVRVSDQEKFKNAVKDSYDLNDESLMANEFFAHILQTGAEEFQRNSPTMLALIEKYKKIYLDDLASKGLKLIR